MAGHVVRFGSAQHKQTSRECCDPLSVELSLAIPVLESWGFELYCTCRCFATFAAQSVVEYNAGGLEDQGLDALAAAQEPQFVSSKSKMQVCHRGLSSK